MSLRERFPFFRHHPSCVYLDSAASAQKPDTVIDAITQFYTQDYATVHRAAYRQSLRATQLYSDAREATRHFLNAAHTDEIVFTRGTTDSINLVARTFPFEAGDEIILSKMEHHSNLLPWQMIAKEKGVVLKWIELKEDGTIDLNLPITERTKLIAVTHVSNVTGSVVPLQEIVRLAKTVGAAVLADGAQAAVHLPIDVQKLGVDFYAFSGHKCYGPTGIGVLYGKAERLAVMPPLQGGGGMVTRVDLETSEYELPPLRFEAGTPMSASAMGLKAALEFIAETRGTDEHKLLTLATESLKEIEGLTIIGTASDKAPILSFSIEGVHPLDLATFLDTKEIAIRSGHLCAQPLLRFFGIEHVARASFALYNSEEDVHRFADAVHLAVKILRQ
jgi:cysteine desulfurase/selenocysteine lyase